MISAGPARQAAVVPSQFGGFQVVLSTVAGSALLAWLVAPKVAGGHTYFVLEKLQELVWLPTVDPAAWKEKVFPFLIRQAFDKRMEAQHTTGAVADRRGWIALEVTAHNAFFDIPKTVLDRIGNSEHVRHDFDANAD